MEYIIKVLKNKAFYVVLLLAYVVSSAMTFNRTHNKEELEAYYGNVELPTETNKLIAYALAQEGKPYRYAGKGPNSFDCSGFTGYVYRKFNVALPASAHKQSTEGVEVEIESILPGDLLFFSKYPKSGINHVGIAIRTGEKGVEFIHSTTSKGVMVDNLQSNHYRVRYKGARRVLL